VIKGEQDSTMSAIVFEQARPKSLPPKGNRRRLATSLFTRLDSYRPVADQPAHPMSKRLEPSHDFSDEAQFVRWTNRWKRNRMAGVLLWLI
jgi:hypothetical protein